MNQSNNNFKDVNKERILYSLCCDASNFTGFPQNAKLLMEHIRNVSNGNNEDSGNILYLDHSKLFKRMSENK